MKKIITGLHIISDLYYCDCDMKYFLDYKFMSTYLYDLICNVNLTPVGNAFYSFGEESGFTGMIILAESHLSVHTWAEERMVNVDIFVCNVSQNNSHKAQFVYECIRKLYQPLYSKCQEIKR